MTPDPSSGRVSRALLRFAKYSDRVHTGAPLSKILDPPQQLSSQSHAASDRKLCRRGKLNGAGADNEAEVHLSTLSSALGTKLTWVASSKLPFNATSQAMHNFTLFVG